MAPEAGETIFAVVRFDLADHRFLPEFTEWYNAVHIPELVARDGYRRAWRLREIAPRRSGSPEFSAVYEVDAVDRFRSPGRVPPSKEALAAEDAYFRHLSDSNPMKGEPFVAAMTHWARRFYRVTSSLSVERPPGEVWARQAYALSPGSRAMEFRARWAANMSALLESSTAISCAWLLESAQSDIQIGENQPGKFISLTEWADLANYPPLHRDMDEELVSSDLSSVILRSDH